MAVMALNHQQVSDILNPDKLSFADGISARIQQFIRSHRIMHLRRLVLLATEDAMEMNAFLQDTLITYDSPTFVWESVSDNLADKLRHVLSAYHDTYQQADNLKKMHWLTRQLTALDRYVTIAKHNNSMIREILLMLEEDREDVLAAHAALADNQPTLPLEEAIQGLRFAA